MDEHIKQLLEVGTLTGSRAFSCATSESDWDIVILQKDLPTILTTNPYIIISDTDFTNDEYVDVDGTFGIDVSEHEEFDEAVIEYDKATIWGPLDRILKYNSPSQDSNEIINLFVYSDRHKSILPKFQEVTHLMNFLYGPSLTHKPTRIEAFTKVLASVGITDLK